MKKDPRVYLAQILERIERISNYTSEGKKEFFSDQRTQDAVIRNFEVIGEVAKRIPETYRKTHPKPNIFSRFQPIAGLTLQFSFCIWVFIGWSRLGLGAASAAAQHVVTHPQPSHNPINFDFFLDSLLKSEFLSFDVISHIVELV